MKFTPIMPLKVGGGKSKKESSSWIRFDLYDVKVNLNTNLTVINKQKLKLLGVLDNYEFTLMPNEDGLCFVFAEKGIIADLFGSEAFPLREREMKRNNNSIRVKSKVLTRAYKQQMKTDTVFGFTMGQMMKEPLYWYCKVEHYEIPVDVRAKEIDKVNFLKTRFSSVHLRRAGQKALKSLE